MMKLFKIFRKLLVGRNARWLRTPPTTEIGSAQPVVILSETKDLKARFFANEVYCVQEAQNDKTPTPPTPSREGARSGVRGSRVQPRNPAYENNQNDKKPTPHPPLPQAGRKQSQERVKKGCVTLTRACGVANFQHRWFMNEDPHPRSLRSRNQPLAGLRLPQKREGLKTAPFRMTFMLLCLLLLLGLVSPVAAQEPTTRLLLNPTPLLIDTTISPTGVVNLEVADGVDIFAFDLIVQYDPALLYVSQVSLGDFLGMGLLCMDQINNPGLVHYNCTRFGVDTGVSGSGVLLTLTFEALGQGGDTLLSLEGSQLYDWPDASFVELTREDGAVSVRPFRTFLPLILSASGQGGTVLAVDPAQSSVEVNGQREISLLVSDADNLNAFDVQVEYNGDLLTLVKWEFGDLLSNLAVVKRDDLPGSFRLVATQLATPGVSGDGVLLKLTFSGKLEGSSAINITKAEFARSEGGLSLPELQNGNITIIPAQPERRLNLASQRMRAAQSWRKQQGTLPAQPIRRVEMDISCSEALATISTLVW